MPILDLNLKMEVAAENFNHHDCSELIIKVEKFINSNFPVLLMESSWDELPIEGHLKRRKVIISMEDDYVEMNIASTPDPLYYDGKKFCNCNSNVSFATLLNKNNGVKVGASIGISFTSSAANGNCSNCGYNYWIYDTEADFLKAQ